MDQHDLEAMMLQMQLWPYRQPTAEDRAVDLAFERAEADQRRDDAYKKLSQAIGGMLGK